MAALMRSLRDLNLGGVIWAWRAGVCGCARGVSCTFAVIADDGPSKAGNSISGGGTTGGGTSTGGGGGGSSRSSGGGGGGGRSMIEKSWTICMPERTRPFFKAQKNTR